MRHDNPVTTCDATARLRDSRRARTDVRRTNRGQRNNRLGRAARRAVVEMMESRLLLTSTLYLDFGDHFPTGGLGMTLDQLRNEFTDATPGLRGPNIEGVPPMPGNTAFTFNNTQSLTTFDYDGSGTVDAADYSSLRDNVLSLVQRYYQPFDINVQLAPALANSTSADYMDGIRTTLQGGPNALGEYDVWMFVASIIRNDTGNQARGLQGVAVATVDNSFDKSALAFAANILAGNETTADTRLAYTIAHEAGHSFGLAHTIRPASAGAGEQLLLQSDLMPDQAGNVNRDNFIFFTRFPLSLNDTAGTVNNYLALADPSRLGPASGGPAYVTGTGAFDLITLSSGGGTTVNVSVQAFQEAAFTNQIGATLTYTVDRSNGVLVETGFSADRLVVNADIASAVTVRGMAGDDQLVVMGNGAPTGTYEAGRTHPFPTTGVDGNQNRRGLITIGATAINFEEFETTGSISIKDVGSLRMVTRSGPDALTMENAATAGWNRVYGSFDVVPLEFTNVAHFTIDTCGDVFDVGDDTVTIRTSAPAGGLTTLTVDSGDGDDQLTVDYSWLTRVPPSAGLFYAGGAGEDTLQVLGVIGQVENLAALVLSGGASGDLYGASLGHLSFAGTENLEMRLKINQLSVELPDGTANAITYDKFAHTLAGPTIPSVFFLGLSPIWPTEPGVFWIDADANDTVNLPGSWQQHSNEVKDGKTYKVYSGSVFVKISQATQTPLFIHGSAGAGADSFQVSPAGAGKVNLFRGGSLIGVYSNVSRVVMYGFGGNDVLDAAESLNVPVEFHGGPGNDLLRGGMADDLLFGDEGDDRMEARKGNDILVGGSGNDVLRGVQGWDIVIGGTGADWLFADEQWHAGGQDLLITGSTIYDNDVAALETLRAEWTKSAVDYTIRIANLAAGVAGGSLFLRATESVQNDGEAVDWIFAYGERDWFFASRNDKITDQRPDEQVVWI